MNSTNIRHVLYALLMQAPTLFFNSWLGAAFASAWFISREHAQRENQISRERVWTVEGLKWWEGFTGWTRDRYLDAGMPALVTAALAWVW